MQAVGGENMAGTHERVSANASRKLQSNLVYTDIWTDPAKRAVDAPLTIDYSGVPVAPVNGVIDYETHIAPIWASHNCASCHDGVNNATAGRHALDMSNTMGGAGRQASYDSLLIGDPQLDSNGQPVLEVDNGEIRVVLNAAQVDPGFARGSHLVEVLFNQQLKSTYTLGATGHSAMLNASEKRLVSEWVDLGAQYFNSPRDASNGNALRGVTGMDQTVFDTSIHAILLNRCGSCHDPVGAVGAAPPNFVGRRFVLTGDPEGDFNVTLSMVGNRALPMTTELLRRPASTGTGISPNPLHGLLNGLPILSTSDPDYVSICAWISTTGLCH